MNTLPGVVALVVVLFAFGAAIGWLMDRRARGMLARWAENEGYEIVSAQFRLGRRGPFWFSGRGHVVYRLEVRDQAGWEWQGWARCGSWLFGVASDQVETRWDRDDT